MKLTKRENRMLKVLGVIFIGVIYVIYLMMPGYAHYKQLKIELPKVEERYNDAVNSVATEKTLDKRIDTLAGETNNFLEKYFTTTKQEELVLLLNDFIEEGLNVSDISYSNFTELMVGDRALKQLTAEIQYTGEYSVVLEFLRTNWKFYKQIGVDQVVMEKTEEGQLAGVLTLHYYWAPESSEYDDQLFHWVQNEAYNKGNPFDVVNSIDKTNYIYIGGDKSKLEELFNKPFADVTGHWAEAEIESFRQSGYVIADDQNRFLPDGYITRGEFIIMLDKIYEWDISEEDVDLSGFTDFDELGNYEGAIAKAILKGYMGGYVIGYTDNTLRPRDPISYEEVEYIMAKVKKDEFFTWETVANEIQTKRNITSLGLTDKTQSLTRAEAVYLMYFYK